MNCILRVHKKHNKNYVKNKHPYYIIQNNTLLFFSFYSHTKRFHKLILQNKIFRDFWSTCKSLTTLEIKFNKYKYSLPAFEGNFIAINHEEFTFTKSRVFKANIFLPLFSFLSLSDLIYAILPILRKVNYE